MHHLFVPSALSSIKSDRILLASSIISAIFILLRFSEYIVGSVGDDAVYTEMARSIAEGRGPKIHLSDCSSYLPFAFPAGYPFLLSPLASMFPASTRILQLLSVLLPLSAIPFYYIYKQQPIYRPLLIGSICLFVVNPWTIAYANRVLSESAYTFFSLMTLLAYSRWRQDPSPLTKNLVLVVIFIGLSASIRTIGLALPLAMFLHLLLRFKWSHLAALFTGFVLSMIPQFALNAQRGGSILSPGYQAQVLDHVQSIGSRLSFMASNAVGYLNELPAALVPIFGNHVQASARLYGLENTYIVMLSLTSYILILLISWGAWILHSQRAQNYTVPLLYLAIYCAALLNFSGWPSGVQLRLLIPIMPIFYLLFILGCNDLLTRINIAPQRTIHWVIWSLLLLSTAHNIYRITNKMSQTRNTAGRGFVDYSSGSAWVRAHTQPNDTILARYPLERHIHLNRPLVNYPEDIFDPKLLQLTECHITHLFVSPGNPDSPDSLDNIETQIKSMAESHTEIFEIVYKNVTSATYIYRVRKQPD